MSRRRERPRSWPAEPEATSATGGHLPPEVDAAGPLFDPLFDPLPPEPRRVSTVETPRSFGDELTAVPEDARRPVRRKLRPAVRRVKRTLKRVDPFSVLKLSLFYYAIFVIFWLIFVAFAYWIVDSMGVFDAIEEFGRGFALEWGKVDISLALVEKWAFLIGVILAIVGSIVNAFLAFLYNLASDVVGGLELTFVERDV